MEFPELNALDARDRLVIALGLGLPSPLRDLPLQSESMADVGQSSEVRIRRAQAGVRYQLCDEDGNVLTEPTRAVLSPVDPGEEGVSLLTPPIHEDVTFSILATREDAAGVVRVAAYLARTVSIKVGLNTKLPVRFTPALGQTADGLRIVVPFGLKPDASPVVVNVDASQEGVSYHLVLKDRPRAPISEVVRGNRGTIYLPTNDGFEEDALIRVKAFRTTAPEISELLDAVLQVDVLPNIRLTLTANPLILDYQGRTRLELAAPQSSAEYQWFQQPILPADYAPADPAVALVVPTEQGRSIGVRIVDRSGDGRDWPGFAAGGALSGSSKSLQADSDPLTDDTVFVVRATKKVSQESQFLLQPVPVLVRPDPTPKVTALTSPTPPGAEGFVVVDGAQRGVRYQLRRAADNVDLNQPGYHVDDRGIESARLGVDFVVEDAGEARVLLPTGPLAVTTEFYVVAEKFRTGLTAELAQRATLEVVGSPAPAPPRVRAPKPEPAPPPTPETLPAPAAEPVLEPTPAPPQPQAIGARSVRRSVRPPQPEPKSKAARPAKGKATSTASIEPALPMLKSPTKRKPASSIKTRAKSGLRAVVRPTAKSKPALPTKSAVKPNPPTKPKSAAKSKSSAKTKASTAGKSPTATKSPAKSSKATASVSTRTAAKPKAKPQGPTARQPKRSPKRPAGGAR